MTTVERVTDFLVARGLGEEIAGYGHATAEKVAQELFDAGFLTESNELDQYRELAGLVATGEYPLLPRPEWNQDVAFIAFTIDGLLKRSMNQ
jgi:hypothetical protein